MSLPSPIVLVHLCFALGALLLGPFALAARKGSRWHRAGGYAWVTLMLGAALSSLFIHNYVRPNWGGYTPIHLLVPAILLFLGFAVRAVVQGQVLRHRRLMLGTYISGCLVAGGFTLLPNRYLGQLVWHHWLGLA
ncbi:DUF2306 domain-containing protein [Aquabacterium sp. A7-Y]|uniref:DUF2306 domain-containing protein n=1 Tax=Aquabacterium sp. A7-Y TaxID=1349605 RepID=UPI00223D80D4|nr:DUF2306 domain-containing protein [Aquabacterium sp. A7-Y]MCW7539285.1 DUF2306 domain-containing protein [Aquabacterium sp. A7-Y]